MIGYHLLLGRKHGAQTGYPILVSFDDVGAVQRKYVELTSAPAVAPFAAEHAEILFVSDGAVLANHDFPDPTEVERQRKLKVLATARQVVADNDKAAADLEAAKRIADAAQAAIRKLNPEQRKLIAEEKTRLDAISKAHEKEAAAERERLAAEAAAREKAATEAKARSDAQAARATFIAEISSQSDAALAKLATDNKADVPTDATRDQVIAAIADAAGLKVPDAEPAK